MQSLSEIVVLKFSFTVCRTNLRTALDDNKLEHGVLPLLHPFQTRSKSICEMYIPYIPGYIEIKLAAIDPALSLKQIGKYFSVTLI